MFPLSFRDVELLLHERGILVSHEAIRAWCYKFGPHFAQGIRRKRRMVTDKWHLDEVFVTINGRRYYLWRAVDSKGMVLDILMQTRRNAKAAKHFFEDVLDKTASRPRVIVTDGLRSYNVISRDLLPAVEHRRSKYLNNRAENSHQPTRRRERRMQRFNHCNKHSCFYLFSMFFTTTFIRKNINYKLMCIAISLNSVMISGHNSLHSFPLLWVHFTNFFLPTS